MTSARLLTTLLALALVTTGCEADSGRTWFAYDDQVIENGEFVEELEPTVFEGDGYSIGSGSQRFGQERLPCAQIVIGDTPLFCVHAGGGSYSGGPGRIGDTRFVGAHVGEVIDRAIAWSSVSPGGREIDVVEAGVGSTIVWVMEPGEEPWGLQLLRADGTVFRAASYVGLSGE